MSEESIELPVERITEPPNHHYFGYYDKCCWSADGRYILGQESPFMGRDPDGAEPLTIGVIDREHGNRFTPVGETLAWNWQQGCMLRWLPPDDAHVLCYNALKDDHYVNLHHDLRTGQTVEFPYALYDITGDGRFAVTGSFERVNGTRPGYGYFCLPDPKADVPAPSDEGLFVIDMNSRESRLIFSLADALEIGTIRPEPGWKTWFNHMTFNPSGNRFLFLHRCAPHAVPGHEGFKTRMLTIDRDGSNVAAVLEGIKISHFVWLDDEQILVWLEGPDRGIHGYYLVHDPSGEMQPVGEGLFAIDGHCNLSPDRKWMVTDMYPKNQPDQPLFLYEMATGRKIQIGAFKAMLDMNTSWRCDLHTRWNRDGTQVCFDSTHEGTRQMYVIDVSSITRA